MTTNGVPGLTLGNGCSENGIARETQGALFKHVAAQAESSGNKVTIVGVGQVGMACAFTILTQVNFTLPQNLLHDFKISSKDYLPLNLKVYNQSILVIPSHHFKTITSLRHLS